MEAAYKAALDSKDEGISRVEAMVGEIKTLFERTNHVRMWAEGKRDSLQRKLGDMRADKDRLKLKLDLVEDKIVGLSADKNIMKSKAEELHGQISTDMDEAARYCDAHMRVWFGRKSGEAITFKKCEAATVEKVEKAMEMDRVKYFTHGWKVAAIYFGEDPSLYPTERVDGPFSNSGEEKYVDEEEIIDGPVDKEGIEYPQEDKDTGPLNYLPIDAPTDLGDTPPNITGENVKIVEGLSEGALINPYVPSTGVWGWGGGVKSTASSAMHHQLSFDNAPYDLSAQPSDFNEEAPKGVSLNLPVQSAEVNQVAPTEADAPA